MTHPDDAPPQTSLINRDHAQELLLVQSFSDRGGLPCGGENSLLDFTPSRSDPTPPSWPLFILRTDQAGFSFEPTSDQPQARLNAHNTGSGAGSTEGRKITVEARSGPLRAEKAVRASQTRLAVLKARNGAFPSSGELGG